MRRRGFTLIELMVVLGMIAVLMGALGASVVAAKRRAKVSRALQETKEMTNAILAFEQYARNRSLDDYTQPGWADCTESSMRMILGGEMSESGEKVPVLYGAATQTGNLLDPWNKPYQYRIERTGRLSAGQGSGGEEATYLTAPWVMNMNRLSKSERGF